MNRSAKAKTKESARKAQASWIEGLFGHARSSLPAVLKPEAEAQRRAREVAEAQTLTKAPSQESDLPRGTVTRVRPANELTSPSRLQVVNQENQKERARSKRRERDERSKKVVGAVLLLATSAMVGYALLMPADQVKRPFDRAEFEKRVQFHRQETGTKLNMDRINVEYENMQTAPSISGTLKKVPDANMMNGLPLVEEPHHRKSSRDRLLPTNPNYPDARIQYGLQEERDAAQWEEEAQEAYVKDFVANAAKAGYKVHVDKAYNVTVDGQRAPNSAGQPPAGYSKPGRVPQ